MNQLETILVPAMVPMEEHLISTSKPLINLLQIIQSIFPIVTRYKHI
jgi:hypothetical protein